MVAALCVEDQIQVGYSAQAVKKQQRKRKRIDLEEDKDSLLESRPGIEIQEAKPTVEEEEMERLESWSWTWSLSQLQPKQPHPLLAFLL
eukprot:2888521-Amphidinium_carterae.1